MDKDRMERFSWTGKDGNEPKVITNDTIQCHDCVNRTEPRVMECIIYEEKPGYVIDNTKKCEYYKKKAE